MAAGAADEDELWSTIAPMAARKSRLGRCGSGGGHRQRGGGASRWPRANLRSAEKWERVVAAVNLECRAPAPLPFFIARATGAHQPYGLDAPDQGVFKESSLIFGSSPWRSSSTFSRLISHCSYSCSVSEFGSSYRRSVYRACLVMTVITVRLTATITFPVWNRVLFLGPLCPGIIGFPLNSCRLSVL